MLTVEWDCKTILELGTRTGESTTAFLLGAEITDGHVFSVDVNPCPAAAARVKEIGLEDRWTFLQTDDMDLPWDAVTHPWVQELDMLFIDTSHVYEHTVGELRKFEPWVRDGGVIVMHDPISFPGVLRAATELVAGRPDLRLYKYVHNNGLLVIFKGRRR